MRRQVWENLCLTHKVEYVWVKVRRRREYKDSSCIQAQMSPLELLKCAQKWALWSAMLPVKWDQHSDNVFAELEKNVWWKLAHFCTFSSQLFAISLTVLQSVVSLYSSVWFAASVTSVECLQCVFCLLVRLTSHRTLKLFMLQDEVALTGRLSACLTVKHDRKKSRPACFTKYNSDLEANALKNWETRMAERRCQQNYLSRWFFSSRHLLWIMCNWL